MRNNQIISVLYANVMAVLLGIPFIVLFVTEATKRMIRKKGMQEGMYFLDIVKNNILKDPEHIVVYSPSCSKGITYKKFDDYTGRIYHYLKSRGIGREDMVLICLPRGARVIVALYGILKAGAGFCVVESNYSPERIRYIENDLNVKLSINEDVYREMMKYDPIEGYEKADPHDACFAVYTSGSTGNPKGILHEYGKLDEMRESDIKADKKNYAIISPLSFLAAVRIVIDSLVTGPSVFIVPYDIVKNPELFVKYMVNNQITDTFATSSFLKLLPSIPKSLERVYVGGEVVCNCYIPGLKLYNIYSSSEIASTTQAF